MKNGEHHLCLNDNSHMFLIRNESYIRYDSMIIQLSTRIDNDNNNTNTNSDYFLP